MPAPGVGAICGSCPSGFTGDGLKCYGKNLILVITMSLLPSWCHCSTIDSD